MRKDQVGVATGMKKDGPWDEEGNVQERRGSM